MWTDREQIFAEGFHVGFRKGMDSEASVIVWNILYILDGVVKHEFVKQVLAGEGTLKERCLNAEALKVSKHDIVLFRFGMDMMTDAEWENLEDYWVKEALEMPDDISP